MSTPRHCSSRPWSAGRTGESDLRFLRLRRCRFFQRRRIHIEVGDRNHFDILETLLQRRQKLLGVADDDYAGVVAVEVCGGKLLDVSCGHALHAADVTIDLIKTKAVKRQRADAADDSGVGLELPAEAADEHGLARPELVAGDGGRAELVHLVDNQPGPLARRFVLRLRRGAERTDFAAQIEGTVRAVAETALDANLFVQAG